jgi:hypothetical protein
MLADASALSRRPKCADRSGAGGDCAPALATSQHADAVKSLLEKIAKEPKNLDVRRQAEVIARSIPPRTLN